MSITRKVAGWAASAVLVAGVAVVGGPAPEASACRPMRTHPDACGFVRAAPAEQSTPVEKAAPAKKVNKCQKMKRAKARRACRRR